MNPKLSTKKPSAVDLDAVIKKDLNGEVSKVNNEYKAVKGTVNARVTKSVSFTEHELDVVLAFLKEQNMSIGDFVRVALFRDGAFDSSFLAATSFQKRLDVSFMKIDPSDWTYEYKNTFENFEDSLAQDVAYNKSKRKPKSFFILSVMEQRIQKHLDKKGWPSFSAFVKTALSTSGYGVYSEALSNIVLSSLHTTKTQAKSKKKKSENKATSAKPLSSALHPQARLLYDKLNAVAKEKYEGLTLALVIKFMMIKKGIISDDLLERNSPRNPAKKKLVDSFLDALNNNKIQLDFTSDEREVLKDRVGLRKNITVSFSANNFTEIKEYISKEGVTFAEMVIEWLNLEGVE